MVEAVLVCSISLLETLMGVFYTKVCTQKKYEKYQNGFGTWQPLIILILCPKRFDSVLLLERNWYLKFPQQFSASNHLCA
jgi:hypothetical protein